MIDRDEVERFWDGVASRTTLADKTYVGMLTDGNEFNAIYRQKEEQAHFLRIFSPTTTMNALEVGCGGGRWALFLANRMRLVVGIDISGKMIEVAENLKRQRGIDNVHFLKSDLLPFTEQDTFDLVYFSGVLQYIDDEKAAESIEKARRLLAPGGIVISRDTVHTRERKVLSGDYPVLYRTTAEYESLFARTGFLLDYTDLSYQPRRFSGIASRLHALPVISYGAAFRIQSFLIFVDRALGHPAFLGGEQLSREVELGGRIEHRFFRYTLP